jgi:hypothetical protein
MMKNIMKKYPKNILYGFFAWLIPFVASFFFYTREGELTIDIFLFKSIIVRDAVHEINIAHF